MMCSYHPQQRAAAYCSTCGRALCTQCDHRVKGYPHCQDCIVRGIELLRVHRYTDAPVQGGAPRGSTWKALLLGIIPGLGAVYNRQNAKAFLEFTSVVGLAELSEFTKIGLFGALAAFVYLFSIFDAVRTARAIQSGRDASAEEERLRKFLREHMRGWSLVLVGVGALILTGHVFSFMSLGFLARYLLPSVLVLLGLYFLRERWRRNSSFSQTLRDRSDIPGYGRKLFSTSGHLGSLADPSDKIMDITSGSKRGG